MTSKNKIQRHAFVWHQSQSDAQTSGQNIYFVETFTPNNKKACLIFYKLRAFTVNDEAFFIIITLQKNTEKKA